MSYKLDLKIHELPTPINRRNGQNPFAAKRYRDDWHTIIMKATMGKRPPEPLKYARLTLVRFSSVCPDFDGLVSSWKPVIDGLIHARIIEDDSMKNIGMPKFHWEKAPPKKGWILVRVEELESSDLLNHERETNDDIKCSEHQR